MTGFKAATRVNNITFYIGVLSRVTCEVRCEMYILKKGRKILKSWESSFNLTGVIVWTFNSSRECCLSGSRHHRFGVRSTAASNIINLNRCFPQARKSASNGNLSSQVYERQTTSAVTDSNRLFDRDKAFTRTITPGERSKDLWQTNWSYAKGPRCCRSLHDSSLLIQWFKEYANRLTC